MKYNTSIKDIMNFIVPITRFNRGEASKIFDEVEENGFKIVIKNNIPACVLVKPARYEEMIEMLDDYSLFFEAEKRLETAATEGYISNEQVLNELGIRDSDLDEVEVDIE